MREIKFRAFDKDDEYMMYSDDDTDDYFFEICKNKIIVKSITNINDEYPSYDELNNVEIMQYIGLKDKNENEIYEGDIVKLFRYSDETCKHEYIATGEIIFDFGRFCIKYVDKDSYILNNDGSKSPHILKRDFESLWRPGESYEVIGNIYENSELIK